jgi:hypothetical protein
MFSSPYPEENTDEDYVTLTDAEGRSLSCTVEYSLEVQGQEYLLLLPVDIPVEIFTWAAKDLERPTVLVEEDEEIDEIFDKAQVVLSEHCLTLQRTAVTLTVQGDLPELDEEEFEALNEEEEESDDDSNYYEELATFSHKNRQYAIYTPVDPFFIPARQKSNGKLDLLSEEEFQKIEPTLQYMFEEQIFDDLE